MGTSVQGVQKLKDLPDSYEFVHLSFGDIYRKKDGVFLKTRERVGKAELNKIRKRSGYVVRKCCKAQDRNLTSANIKT